MCGIAAALNGLILMATVRAKWNGWQQVPKYEAAVATDLWLVAALPLRRETQWQCRARSSSARYKTRQS
jgi:hypothetical protein